MLASDCYYLHNWLTVAKYQYEQILFRLGRFRSFMKNIKIRLVYDRDYMKVSSITGQLFLALIK